MGPGLGDLDGRKQQIAAAQRHWWGGGDEGGGEMSCSRWMHAPTSCQPLLNGQCQSVPVQRQVPLLSSAKCHCCAACLGIRESSTPALAEGPLTV